MSRSNNRKIAVTLLGALAFGASDASAMNTSKNRTQNPQTVGTVGGVRNQTKKINWKKIAKIGGFSVAGLVALEAVHSAIGGFTDSKFGNYSIGRAIKNYVNKNNQPGPEDENPNPEGNDKKDDQDQDLKEQKIDNENSDVKVNDEEKKFELPHGVVTKIKGGLQRAKGEIKNKNINVNNEYNNVLVLLRSIASSEVISTYKDLKSLLQSDDNFVGLTIDLSGDRKGVGYKIIFKKQDDYTGYLLYKLNDTTGVVQPVRWNDKTWNNSGADAEFQLR